MNQPKVRAILVMVLACFIVIAGCSNKEDVGSNQKESTENQLHIVTTFYPMYEFTKNITNENAQVDLLIPSNIEPHDWEPTPKDMAMIQKADVLIYNSDFMETWISSIKESLGKEQPQFVEASKGIPLMKGDEHDHHEEEGDHDDVETDHLDEGEVHEEGNEQLDPHVWLSPVLAQQEVQTITEAIVKQDPKNKDDYESNSQEYIQKLKDLDELFRKTLQHVSSKEIITQHAAFGYLAKEYGLIQIPIAGLSPSEEPSPSKLAELKEFAKEHHINVIYFEETTSPKVAITLAAELGAETEILNTIEGLSKEDQEEGLSYIEVMKNNLKSLEKSLVK
ncbi:metal ABC transporter substrate-binding protein [Metabacillus sediminilitoris]|uniref:Zinc ABC transporter substrate-binding protein n=1 Tax=Metabacillus sediminilitoris TaxID=2567941 RepID=A0A4S4BJP6_9BACI|nr:metal ABC transporter substrate-binding protein [Metabacillus sediminilitoris]QGQ45738.1 zinc ABC transporter substrate-binding protein [Metabacillus sediminilitoris]THF74880.1 zinc ABC transporter substrate-binding protein [Metabacillus sediminilitoris]